MSSEHHSDLRNGWALGQVGWRALRMLHQRGYLSEASQVMSLKGLPSMLAHGVPVSARFVSTWVA